MAQGFKAKKACSSLSKPPKTQPVKKGRRVIPPTKPAAVTRKLRTEKVSANVNADIERLVVSKSVGKLTIMKPLKEAAQAKLQDGKTKVKASKT